MGTLDPRPYDALNVASHALEDWPREELEKVGPLIHILGSRGSSTRVRSTGGLAYTRKITSLNSDQNK